LGEILNLRLRDSFEAAMLQKRSIGFIGKKNSMKDKDVQSVLNTGMRRPQEGRGEKEMGSKVSLFSAFLLFHWPMIYCVH